MAEIQSSAFHQALAQIERQLDTAARATVADAILLMRRQAKSNASGQARWRKGEPGPRAKRAHSGGPGVVKGTFGRSIVSGGPRKVGDTWVGWVGSSLAYSRRLEKGFSGTDVLGRTYAQPAYPSVNSARRVLRADAFRRLMETNLKKAMRVG